MRGVKFNIKHLDYQSKEGSNTNTHSQQEGGNDWMGDK